MRNRAAIPIDSALSEQAQPAPATWQSDVLIPLTTNALSGVAWAGGAAIAWYWAAGGEMPDVWLAACGSIGAIWAIAWTVIRYNGDEIGLFRGAYQAGRRSRDAEVNHLRMQLETYRDAVTAASGNVSTTEANELIARANATLINAVKLLRVIYEHGAAHAKREEMAERHMGQRDWERAKALCISAGVVDQVLQPLAGDYGTALKRIKEVHGANVAEMRKSKSYRPVWS